MQEVVKGFRISPQQKRLWLLQHDSPAFHSRCAIALDGPLDTYALKEAVHRLVQRHEILRTNFECLPGMRMPVQVVSDDDIPLWRDIDLSDLDPAQQELQVEELFLESGGFTFVRRSDVSHVLFVSLPSLCADARSLENLVVEIRQAYLASLGDEAERDEPVQYAQFSAWQHELLEEEDGEAGRQYWLEKAITIASPPSLPFEAEPAAASQFDPHVLQIELDRTVFDSLENAAQRNVVPTSVFLLASWQTLLWRLTGRSDIPVGLRYDGRVYEEMSGALGLYEKWPLVQCHFEESLTFTKVLELVNRSVVEVHEWQEYFSWEHCAELLEGEPKDAHLFTGFDYAESFAPQFAGAVQFSLSKQYSCTERFKLRLSCVRSEETIRLEFHYDPELYTPGTIESLAERFSTLLQSAAARPESLIGELQIIGEAERRRLLIDRNNTAVAFDHGVCVQHLFEAQAARTPDRLAFVYNKEQLTYRELNERANQLAHLLVKLGVGPETRVALCLERSAEMIISLLAILKAGGAYVPLDPAQPTARLSMMLSDSQAALLITHKAVAERLPCQTARVLCLEEERETVEAQSTANPDIKLTPDALAYVIYTSGSTGHPKGAMISHASVINLVEALSRAVDAGTSEALRVSVNAPLSFDSSVKQVMQLLRGHTLCVIPEQVRRDGGAMVQYLAEQQVDVLDCTPSQLRMLLAAGFGTEESEKVTVRRVLVGGEAISPRLWAQLSTAQTIEYYNVYGPTECTVDATVQRIEPGKRVTIGSPVANVQVYVLDEQMRLAPDGVCGELCIGGAGVGRGYLNRAELTAERFIPDQYGSQVGGRLYRTGDMARWTETGQLEYLGRTDGQVKVRGSRIEVGEVEAALGAHAGVHECSVVTREDVAEDVRLVAYVVAEADQKLEVNELRSFLREKLPEYMMPAAFVMMEALPLSPNGKVDRLALPVPEQVRTHSDEEFIAERTPTQAVLAGMWEHLLGVGPVRVDDDFFDLGGHSLLAMQLISRVREAFELEVPLPALFENSTLAGFAQRLDALMRGERQLPVLPIEPVSRDRNLPLSFAQQRLWFLHQFNPSDLAYNVPLSVRLKGPLDLFVMHQCLTEIVRRHEALRTTFKVIDGQPVQVVHPAEPLVLPVADLSELPEAAREKEAQRLAFEEAQRQFDLANGPLMRTFFLRLGERDHVALFSLHHIGSDGWSLAILTKEVAVLYDAYSAGINSPLPELPIQYADFACWQRNWLRGEVLEDHLAYWRRQLDGAPPVLPLLCDRPRTAVPTNKGAIQIFALTPNLSAKLKEMCSREGVTLFMLLLAAFQTLLSRLSGQEDIVVSSATANRTRGEIEGLIGFFVNTLVLRTDLSGNPTFQELLKRVRTVTLGAYAHQDLPFEKLVEELQPERNLGHAPLSQVMITLQNTPRKASGVFGLQLSSQEADTGDVKFDLDLSISEGDRIEMSLSYKTALFNDSTIARMLLSFETLLEGIVADPRQRLSELPLLSETRRRQILTEWNDTNAHYPRNTCIHQLFEMQVERTPDATAAEFENAQLTYRELNERANQLAHYLKRIHGVKPGVRVGIQLVHSLETLVALLATLKAGAAYVPVEPAHPRAKLAFMLQDAEISVLLTQHRLLEQLPETEAKIVFLDTDWETIADESRENLTDRVSASDLAYVIYTSGSTGIPKGVRIQHSALVNYIWWAKAVYLQNESLDFPLYSSLAFDLTVTSIYTPLITGNRVVVYRNDTRESPIHEVLRDNKIGVLKLTPSHLSIIKEGDHSRSRIKRLIVGGEAFETALAKKIHESFGGRVEIYNEYGPTEATVGCMIHRYDVERDTRQTVPVGIPAANVQIYVLDDELNPVAENVTGELYIAGDGLAAGYLKRDELTEERFIPNPFVADGKMYRSGDLARRLPEGVLELLGRRDEQVKFHGYRVELNEIRNSLNKHPQVRDSIVIITKDNAGNDVLVAYYVSRQELEVGQLRDFLSAEIIAETIPNVFMHLRKIPLTLNGKVNYQALPSLTAAKQTLGYAVVAPRTPIEEMLVAIWSQVLQVAEVGIHNNFFEMGGHSLLATQIIARVREVLHAELTLRLLFESPTVAGMAEQVEKLIKSGSALEEPPILPVARDANSPLSYAQQRLWFIEQLNPESATYNVASAARLRGKLSAAALERTFSEIIRRHEVLRTSFTVIDGSPVQVVTPPRPADLPLVDLSELPKSEREAEANRLAGWERRRPFDLASYPLLRTTLVRLNEDEHFALLTMHHIVSDGWSMGVLVREVSTLYTAYTSGAASPLAELPIQYADYAAWQRKQLSGEALEQRLSYWRQQLAGAPALLELPTDKPRPALPTTRGDTHSMVLSKPLTQKIKELSQRRGTTLFITLLAAFQTLLLRYTGQEDISIGTPVSGRNRLEMEGLIGFFVNTLVMRGDCSGDPRFCELLERAREVALGAYSNQDVPFEKLVDELQIERSLSHTPLFQVLLVVQNVEQGRLELPGLTLNGVQAAGGTAKFDLTLHVVEDVDHMSATFEYKTDLFEAATIKRMGRHFERLLEGIVADPQQRLSELPLLDETEYQQALVDWNDTAEPIEQSQLCVHEAFEAQVERTPDACALVFKDQRLTYSELNCRANQLAHHLRSLGVGPEILVGICVERSIEMVMAILGTLKAGGAYVPLDINYPPERLAYMLADAKVRLLLTQQSLLEKLTVTDVQTVCLDAEWEQIEQRSTENLQVKVALQNAAYVIYTSGSTGKPKGVVVQHVGIRNLVHAQVKAFNVQQDSRVLQFASLSFDASASEMFITLLSGATLGLAEREALLPGPNLLELMREQKTTIVTLPPSVLATLDGGQLPELKSVVSAGEACTLETVERWSVGRRFINAYGPTEVTVCATVFQCVDVKEKPSIGQPIANAEVYLLDKYLRPVPVGVIGELYVGGMGLARGYLDQPNLTAERFVPHPFSESPGRRLYRTGDLARFLAGGNIEFIGRSDHQVKVRGFRIELGEIEAVLGQHPGVCEALVMVREDAPGEKRLTAYVVVHDEQSIPSGELRQFLKEQLPEYMIPGAFVVLNEFPLTPNGKVNRELLPVPDTQRPSLLTGFVSPATEIERAIAVVWQEVLCLEQVGIHDNFFDLGGNSLLIVKVHSRLRAAFAGHGLMVVDLFRYPTISILAEYLGKEVSSEERNVERAHKNERIKAARKRQQQRRQRQRKGETKNA